MCVSAPPSSTWNWRTLVDSRSLDISSLHNCRYQTHLELEISFLPPPISSWPTYHKHKPNWNGMDKAWSKAAYLQVLYFEIWHAFVGRTSLFSIWCRKYGKGECRVAEKFTQQNVLLVVELICTSVIFSPKRKSGQISDSPMTFELRPRIVSANWYPMMHSF